MIMHINWSTKKIAYCSDRSPATHLHVSKLFIVFAFLARDGKDLLNYVVEFQSSEDCRGVL